MASASIEDAPVSANARNLVIAMPVLARSAATTARVLPSVDMRGRVPRSVVDEPEPEVLRAVATAEHQRGVPRDLGVGLGGHRLDAYAVLRRRGLEPPAVLADDGV